jgi:hypothetical protein
MLQWFMGRFCGSNSFGFLVGSNLQRISYPYFIASYNSFICEQSLLPTTSISPSSHVNNPVAFFKVLLPLVTYGTLLFPFSLFGACTVPGTPHNTSLDGSSSQPLRQNMSHIESFVVPLPNSMWQPAFIFHPFLSHLILDLIALA